jgi:ribosomal-protein-alanine N-acetyltransferase
MAVDEVSTRRLRLRRAQADDLSDLHAVMNHAGAMRYWCTLPHATVAATEQLLAKVIAPDRGDPGAADDYVVERDGRVIGKAGLWKGHELGIILHPDHWGQRLAHEALTALIPHLFARRPEMEAIVADVDPRNAGSLRLLAGLGFVETHRAPRTMKVGEEWCDSIYLALHRDALPYSAASRASSSSSDASP